MITDLEKKVKEDTSVIDESISNYLLKSLAKKDMQTMTTLMSNGNFTFSQKVKLFCELVNMSKIDKAKFKVYAIINYDILNPSYFQNIKNYHTFLLNTYLTPTDASSIPEKLYSATYRMSNNVVRLTKIYTEKTQIYKHKNIFSS